MLNLTVSIGIAGRLFLYRHVQKLLAAPNVVFQSNYDLANRNRFQMHQYEPEREYPHGRLRQASIPQATSGS
jgi:hypothetical protein